MTFVYYNNMTEIVACIFKHFSFLDNVWLNFLD